MSSETKWTPGPWSRGKDGDGQDGYVYCSNALGSAVAICYGSALRYTAFPREEEIANAQLIASAPKLYEALEYAEGLLANYEDCAKPEFEGAHPTTRVNGEDLATLLATVRTALASARGEG